jgi:hypothetical protein
LSSKLWNHYTDKKISSGDEICLETDDPVTRPLPNFKLLEMQWFLHRVAAMSGAAEPQDEYGSDSDDDEGLPMAAWKGLNLDVEDMDMDEAPGLITDRSSSTVPMPSPSSSATAPQVPEEDQFKHATTTLERESTEIVDQAFETM